MPVTNLIVNGDFTNSANRSADGWSGTDIETRPSSVYISGSGSSRVAELNGGTGQTTVMQQTFTVTEPATAELNLDFALRDSGDVGIDGFRIEVLDSSGTVIYTQDVMPTVNSVYDEISASVTFPTAGDYTLRFTEIGDNADGSGAIIDNVELLICFGGETLIDTPEGPVCAKDLQVGQMVMTANGPQPIRWIGSRSVGPEQTGRDPRFCPVRISAGALGVGLPKRDLLVSRQHRLQVTSPIALRMFGQASVLVSALRLTYLPGIYLDTSVQEIDYYHILLDAHEVIYAEGAPAESLLLGQQSLKTFGETDRDEIALMFPELCDGSMMPKTAQVMPSGKQQRQFVRRASKNDRAMIEPARCGASV